MVRAKREASPARRELPRPFDMPWGKGEIVEEATALDEWHEPALQLLRYEDGVSAKTLASLRRALKGAPRLRGLLRKLVAP